MIYAGSHNLDKVKTLQDLNASFGQKPFTDGALDLILRVFEDVHPLILRLAAVKWMRMTAHDFPPRPPQLRRLCQSIHEEEVMPHAKRAYCHERGLSPSAQIDLESDAFKAYYETAVKDICS